MVFSSCNLLFSRNAPVVLSMKKPSKRFTLSSFHRERNEDSTTYAHFLFNAFDTDHNGSVSFEDFVMGLSILLRGTVQEKLNWAFNLYDINKDGYITKEEMLDIMKAIYDMMGKCTYPVLKEDAPRQHVETFFQDENIMRSMQLFENVI
ncbi:hypothetical protein EK904_014297 [Melospiza melodia maxima]|nr:hypothetical protein EK904_014297 [Melospiza melodia maxima]